MRAGPATFRIRIFAGLAALLLVYALGPVSPAVANGTETLGPPIGVTLASGSGIVSGGTGLVTQPGAINLAVPANAGVKQVLLYWEGYSRGAEVPDNTIVVAGNNVIGTLIGGPTHFFDDNGQIFSSSFRADITSLGVVQPGANSVSVSGLTFGYSNDGAGILAIIDDGSDVAAIRVVDGNDLAFANFAPPLDTTAPQTFTVPAASFARSAKLNLMVASVENNVVAGVQRPNKINITVGAGPTTTLTDPLESNDGREWDNLDIPVNIPAGETSVTVQILSEPDGTGNLPASLAWVSGTLSVGTCPPVTNTPSITHGSAYALDVKLVGSHPINKLASVATVAPGSPQSAQMGPLASAAVVNVIAAGVVTTTSDSTTVPSPSSTSTAEVANLSLLNGLVRATTVKAVSQSAAGLTSASNNSNGSTIQGLTVNGNGVAVTPNTKVPVKFAGVTIADLYIYEKAGTSSFGAGGSQATQRVNMLRLVMLKAFNNVPPGTQVIVAHAETDAKGPANLCVNNKSVSGEAFTAFANGDMLGQHLVNTKVGQAVLPATGGADSDGTAVNLPPAATSSTAANTTSGSLTPNPNATSRSIVQELNVLDGAITATTADAKSTSSATGASAGTTFAVTFLNLKVGGVKVAANPAPNTVRHVSLPGGVLVRVILNEQTVNTNGTSDTEGTVNAIHARVFVGGLFKGEVIVASAHSDAHA